RLRPHGDADRREPAGGEGSGGGGDHRLHPRRRQRGRRRAPAHGDPPPQHAAPPGEGLAGDGGGQEAYAGGRWPVIPSSFEYHAPASLADALVLLARHGARAKVLAGGHSLIPAMKLRLASPEVVV